MKKIILTVISVLTASTISLASVTNCQLDNYDGDRRSNAKSLGQELAYVQNTEAKVTFASRLGVNTIALDDQATFEDFEADAYIDSEFVSYLGQTVVSGWLFLGKGKDAGKAVYRSKASCRGGYSGGCSRIGTSYFSCN